MKCSVDSQFFVFSVYLRVPDIEKRFLNLGILNFFPRTFWFALISSLLFFLGNENMCLDKITLELKNGLFFTVFFRQFLILLK